MKKLVPYTFLLFMAQFAICQSKESPYELETKKEFICIGTGLALSSSGLILNGTISPLTVQQIDQLDPSSIGKIDRGAIHYYSPKAGKRSDQLQVVGWLMPFAFAVPKSTRNDFWTIGLMSLETMLLTQGITGVFKSSVQRVRPFAYNENVPFEDKMSIKAKRSFFSGHTSNYATLSFFTAKVISDYSSNRNVKIVVWSLAATSSAFMGHWRVKAGKHFPTDVIAGYLVGAGVGILVPHLHKKGPSKSLSISPYYNSDAVGLNFRWALSK